MKYKQTDRPSKGCAPNAPLAYYLLLKLIKNTMNKFFEKP